MKIRKVNNGNAEPRRKESVRLNKISIERNKSRSANAKKTF